MLILQGGLFIEIFLSRTLAIPAPYRHPGRFLSGYQQNGSDRASTKRGDSFSATPLHCTTGIFLCWQQYPFYRNMFLGPDLCSLCRPIPHQLCDRRQMPIPVKTSTCSEGNRPLVPDKSVQLFQSKASV